MQATPPHSIHSQNVLQQPLKSKTEVKFKPPETGNTLIDEFQETIPEQDALKF